MRLLVVLALAACASHADTLAIRNVTLIDAVHGRAAGMTVVVRGATIVAVGDARSTKIPAHARVLDGRGRYVIPGLWDAHVHLVDVDEPAFGELVAHGVTSVRDMGGDVAKLRAWRARATAGSLVAPRIRFCGPMLEGTPEAITRPDHRLVPNPAAAEAVVAELAAAGVDCIKMRTFADEATYRALGAAAARHHLPLVGHPPYSLDPLVAIAVGQTSFEHGFYPWPWDTVAEDRRRAIAGAFRAAGAVITPTLVAWQAFLVPDATIRAILDDTTGAVDPRDRLLTPALRRNWQIGFADMGKMRSNTPESHRAWIAALDAYAAQLRDLHARGVALVVGTDAGAPLVYPGTAVHEEMKLLVDQVGLRPLEAIAAATLVPAKHAGLERELGTIESGKLADLVVLSADPLADIANVARIDAVVLGGRVVYGVDR